MTHHVLKTYSTEKGVPVCLHENKFFRMMFNGYFHYLDPVRYGKGVATVPVFPNGDLLMVRLRRAPAIGFSIEFPRGGVDKDESLSTAAVRELSEETGYAVPESAATHIGRIGPDTATINGLTDVFLVQVPDTALPGVFDTEEIEQPLRVSLADFERMLQTGAIVDGISLASWALALASGRYRKQELP